MPETMPCSSPSHSLVAEHPKGGAYGEGNGAEHRATQAGAQAIGAGDRGGQATFGGAGAMAMRDKEANDVTSSVR